MWLVRLIFWYAYILRAISVKLFSEVHTMPQKSKSSKVSSKKGNYVKNPAPDDDPQNKKLVLAFDPKVIFSSS